MWIFTRYGFYSISMKGESAFFRGRKKRHLEALKDRFDLPGDIIANGGTDYQWRIVVDKQRAASIVSDLVLEQTWDNFKNEVASYSNDRTYTWSLHEVWSTMCGIEG